MNLKTKTTKELLQLMESIEISPALQIISLNIYKEVLKELRESRLEQIIHYPISTVQSIFDKYYYFKSYNEYDVKKTIEDCLNWLQIANSMCNVVCNNE